MEQDKNKILSDLYAIRATMSIVAEYDDNLRPERRAISELEMKRTEAQRSIEKAEQNIVKTILQNRQETRRNLEGLREKREKKLQEIEEKQEERKKELDVYSETKRYLKRPFAYAAFHASINLALFMIFFGLGTVLSFMLGNFWTSSSEATLATYFLGVLKNELICISATIVLVCFIGILGGIDRRHDARKKFENAKSRIGEIDSEREGMLLEVQAIDREMETEKQRCDTYGEYLRFSGKNTDNSGYFDGESWYRTCSYARVLSPSHHFPEIESLIDAHERNVAEFNRRMDQFEAEKKPHHALILESGRRTTDIVNCGTAMYPLIDFRDWGNVDLLILYFETGRADDMKEALQLVDRQRQTDQITEALRFASNQICRNVERSIQSLGQAIALSFQTLSNQLSQQHRTLARKIEEHSKDLKLSLQQQKEALEHSAAIQVSTQQMNEALFKKISVSSSVLAEQMDRQMREVYGLY